MIRTAISMLLLAQSLNIQAQKLYGMQEVRPGFWMDETEITNNEYREFLFFTDSSQRERFYPDTSVWEGDHNSTMRRYYFEHPAYDNYPVVGVSYDQAVAFCKWRTEYYNKSHEEKIEFRLPTREEWEEIAYPLSFETYAGGWMHAYDLNRKRKKNKFNFNFWQSDPALTAIDGAFYTNQVWDYEPDMNGFYDLSGNVAEMVAEEGVSLGGSWRHESEMAKKGSMLRYGGPKEWLGFRCVALKP